MKPLLILFASALCTVLVAQTNLALPQAQSPASPAPIQIAPNSTQAQQTTAEPKQNPNAFMLPEPKDSFEGKIYAGFWEKYWGACIVILLVLVAGLAIVFRKKAKIQPTPFELAKARLAEIRTNSELLDAKEYATKVSFCVRDYIESVHKIPANEQTTEEFLICATHSDAIDEDARTKLANILKLADKAKFARFAFNQTERETMFASADEFVDTDNLSQQNPSGEEQASNKNDAKEAVK